MCNVELTFRSTKQHSVLFNDDVLYSDTSHWSNFGDSVIVICYKLKTNQDGMKYYGDKILSYHIHTITSSIQVIWLLKEKKFYFNSIRITFMWRKCYSFLACARRFVIELLSKWQLRFIVYFQFPRRKCYFLGWSVMCLSEERFGWKLIVENMLITS